MVNAVAIPAKFVCCFCGKLGKQFASKFPGPGPSERWNQALTTWCASCGSGAVRDARALTEGYYSHDYAAMRKDREIPPQEYFSDANPKLAIYMKRVLHQIRILKSVGARFDNVLDFGSGPGYFLYGAKPQNAYAVELDNESEKYLGYLGAKRIDQDDLPGNFFDVVVSSHSLEHVLPEDLKKTVDQLWSSVRPGGILFVEVPTGARLQLAIPREKAPHTLFFTPDGLRKTLMREGCVILDQGARGTEPYAERENPVYKADERDKFLSAKGNGLYMAIRKG